MVREALLKRPKRSSWEWSEGVVEANQEHFKITYGDDPTPAALVGRGEGTTFLVEFQVGPERSEIVEAVKSELNFYLVDKGEPDPWQYAKYHCGTSSNLYSKVHWNYYLTQ